MPVRSGAVAEAPVGAHISQCGALSEAGAVELELDTEDGAEALAVLVAAVKRVAVGDGPDVPPVAAVDVVAPVLAVDVVEAAVVVVLAGTLTAPEELVARLVPATVAVVAV